MSTTEPIPTGAAATTAAALSAARPLRSESPSGTPARRSRSEDVVERRVLTRPPEQRPQPEKVASIRRIIVQLALIAVLLIVAVLIGASIAATRLADKEAVNNTTNTANLLATSVVQPAVTDGLATMDPAAIAAMNAVVRTSVLPSGIVRVKIWRPDGTVIYSDNAAQIGKRYDLDEEERSALNDPQTRAEVTDLDQPENALDNFSGKLIEVYRPIWTPSGKPLLFEIYSDYHPVSQRAADLRRALIGLLVSTVLLLSVLLAPVVWRLVRQLRHGAQQREQLMQKAVDASEEERRRIAVNLHDGPVQELVASAYATAGAAQRADTAGRAGDAEAIRGAETAVRTSIGSLRSVLVELYPATLASAGLASAVNDLATPLRSRGSTVRLDLADDALAAMSPEQERLVYRTAGECLRNIGSHAEAKEVGIGLHVDDGAVVLAITDDGVGFDVDAALASVPAGHLGLRSMIDQAEEGGAELSVTSAPGAGTSWQLRLPRAEASR